MRVFLGIILLFSSFISIPVFAQTTEDMQTMFKQANEYFGKGEYNQAIVTYQRCDVIRLFLQNFEEFFK